jgi:hypothetical protein
VEAADRAGRVAGTHRQVDDRPPGVAAVSAIIHSWSAVMLGTVVDLRQAESNTRPARRWGLVGTSKGLGVLDAWSGMASVLRSSLRSNGALRSCSDFAKIPALHSMTGSNGTTARCLTNARNVVSERVTYGLGIPVSSDCHQDRLAQTVICIYRRRRSLSTAPRSSEHD